MKNEKMEGKIQEVHLKRRAVVYLRQSSERQVRHNKESQRLQYGLRDRALELGWRDIETIDCDLGSSAAMGSAKRMGFEKLIASVAVGGVGIIFSREASRLSRTNKDWCRLLEVCSLFDTLIGDESQIYNPNNMDDQLILGIKGTISVMELSVLRMRLHAGMEAKARRGELKKRLPAGYQWDSTGKVVKDPDSRIREMVELIFRKFREIQSARGTYLWLTNEGMEVPVNSYAGGKSVIRWQRPTLSYMTYMLQNAFYAGAYVYGRRERKMEYKDGKISKRAGRIMDAEEARVFIKGHHEGYVSWAVYQEYRDIIRRNVMKAESIEAIGAVREGQGLLTGILRCGQCGRKMHVRYWGRKGTAAQYRCKGSVNYGGHYCIGFGGRMVDEAFGQEIIKAISRYGSKAGEKAVELYRDKEDDKQKADARKLKQLEYEEQKAFEQYDEVDPRNRTVAAELERRWNEKLEELEKARDRMKKLMESQVVITEQDQEKIRSLGEGFPRFWRSKDCTPQIKKTIIRTIVEEVLAFADEEKKSLKFIVHWKGGAHTEWAMARPLSAFQKKTKLEDREIISRMACRYGDDDIARVLNKFGHKTGKGLAWNAQRVATVRHSYSIDGQPRTRPDAAILSLHEAARHCKVSQTTIKRLVASGILNRGQIVAYAPWEIRREDLDSEPIQEILNRLKKTGKLKIGGDDLKDQLVLL